MAWETLKSVWVYQGVRRANGVPNVRFPVVPVIFANLPRPKGYNDSMGNGKIELGIAKPTSVDELTGLPE